MNKAIEKVLMEESIKVFNEEVVNKEKVFEKLDVIVPILRKSFSLKTEMLKQWVKNSELKNVDGAVEEFLEQRYEELLNKGFKTVKIKFGSGQDNEISCLPNKFSQEISIEYIRDKTSWEYLDLVFMNSRSRLLKNDIDLTQFQEKLIEELKDQHINFYKKLENKSNYEDLQVSVKKHLNNYRFWGFYNDMIESEINLATIKYRQKQYEAEDIVHDFMEYHSVYIS